MRCGTGKQQIHFLLKQNNGIKIVCTLLYFNSECIVHTHYYPLWEYSPKDCISELLRDTSQQQRSTVDSDSKSPVTPDDEKCYVHSRFQKQRLVDQEVSNDNTLASTPLKVTKSVPFYSPSTLTELFLRTHSKRSKE